MTVAQALSGRPEYSVTEDKHVQFRVAGTELTMTAADAMTVGQEFMVMAARALGRIEDTEGLVILAHKPAEYEKWARSLNKYVGQLERAVSGPLSVERQSDGLGADVEAIVDAIKSLKLEVNVAPAEVNVTVEPPKKPISTDLVRNKQGLILGTKFVYADDAA